MNFCIVGIGNHAVKRIIPSLLLSRGKLIATVSSKKNIDNFNVKNFSNLKLALKNLNKDTVIYLCTPPAIRSNQIVFCLKNSFSVISEKPMIYSLNQYQQFIALLKENKNLFLIENFMYLNSVTFKKFKKLYESSKKTISKININFKIPHFPENTYRDNYNINENIIFDIGCYPISLLANLNIPIESLNFVKKNYSNKKKIFQFHTVYEDILININIGVGVKYQNNVNIIYKNKKLSFNYFFYGLKREKKVISYLKNKNKEYFLYNDIDAFKYLFEKNKSFFMNKKDQSIFLSSNIYRCLSKLLLLVNGSY